MSNQDEDSAQRADVLRRLYFASCLCFTFLIVELLGGYFSRSLAILSDAAHLFSDLASFAIAIIASHLASLPATDQHTFGLKRSESLAALFSMLSLAIVSIGLAFEAVRRLYTNETPVDGKLMSGVATIGVFVNVALAAVLGVENHVHMPGSDHSHDHAHDSDEHDHHHLDCHHHGKENHAHHHQHETLDSINHDHAHRNHHHDHDDISEESHHDNHSHNHDHHSHSDNSHDDDHNHDHHSGRSHADDDHRHDHTHSNHVEDSESEDHDSHSHSHSRHSHDHEHGHHHREGEIDCVASETTKLLSSGFHESHDAVHRDEILVEKVQRNVNLHAAYLHVLSDLAQSVAVLIAGIIIWLRPDWRIVDPICTLLFCALVFYSTLSVIRNSVAVLLEEVPPNINWQKMFDEIQNVKGVQNVHDLHIWSISQSIPSLSVHCSTDRDPQQVLREIYHTVKRQGVKHATIQIQTTFGECITCQGLGCDQARLLTSESLDV
jgi:solute carrier family 30 (zinc transporter), member 2